MRTGHAHSLSGLPCMHRSQKWLSLGMRRREPKTSMVPPGQVTSNGPSETALVTSYGRAQTAGHGPPGTAPAVDPAGLLLTVARRITGLAPLLRLASCVPLGVLFALGWCML